MDIILTAAEVRVLASLVEKELTTPEYYPLTLNALVNACNQKSSRDPVMCLSDSEVAKALESLRARQLAWLLTTAGGRVPKYEHNFPVKWSLSKEEVAVLATLMLRGPQTSGEIRAHTGRLCEFSDSVQVETTLQNLIDREGGPFITLLSRSPGQKENRYSHLFSGLPQESIPEVATPTAVPWTGIEPQSESMKEQQESGMSQDDQIADLREELALLRTEFDEFKRRFE